MLIMNKLVEFLINKKKTRKRKKKGEILEIVCGVQ